MLMKRSLANTSSFFTSSPWTLVFPAAPKRFDIPARLTAVETALQADWILDSSWVRSPANTQFSEDQHYYNNLLCLSGLVSNQPIKTLKVSTGKTSFLIAELESCLNFKLYISSIFQQICVSPSIIQNKIFKTYKLKLHKTNTYHL